VGPLIVEAFRYNRWANLHLLDACAHLDDDQLQWTAAGTYGSIAATWQHLLGGEQRYLERLTGGEPAVNESQPFPGIATLREHAERNGDRLIEAASSVRHDQEQIYKFREGRVRMMPGVILLQALHHGNDHRTHICTILGAHEVSYGDMDGWAYGYATGAAEDLDEAAC
jgi:uncharacterized damage-inducible protein DinB